MPDFIIIGGMKCATSTLHEQLARQQGIFMSTPKEPCFFSDDDIYERGVRWYSSLFEGAATGALCGESSTHYTKLPTYPEAIERMRHHLSARVKFIYIMRHPIDRLVSQYVHEWTQRVVSRDINSAVDALPEMVEYSRYARQIEPYIESFGLDRILPVFFERLSGSPQSELERVCRFIGYPRQPIWNRELGEQNASNERLRKSAFRDAIVNMPGLKQARRVLIPQRVRDGIKSLWMMRQRPALSPAVTARLTDIFNEDLDRLGAWLGLRLNCENFKSIARDTAATWADASATQPRRTAAA